MKLNLEANIVYLIISIIGDRYQQSLRKLLDPITPMEHKKMLRNETIPAQRNLLRVIVGQLTADRKKESLWKMYSLDMGAWDLPRAETSSDQDKADLKHLTQMME
jgi:hypothetical protein